MSPVLHPYTTHFRFVPIHVGGLTVRTRNFYTQKKFLFFILNLSSAVKHKKLFEDVLTVRGEGVLKADLIN